MVRGMHITIMSIWLAKYFYRSSLVKGNSLKMLLKNSQEARGTRKLQV